MKRFFDKTKQGENGCINWTAAKKDGYGVFNRDGRHNILAHRMAWILRHGEIPAGAIVMHRCDNPSCVNADHLSIGTHADNVADKIKKSRGNDGMKHGHAKLTDDQVREIRSLNLNQYVLARHYGVSQSVISEIRRRKAWDHV